MKNLFIDESQKQEILRQHENYKKSIVESIKNRNILPEQAEPIFIDSRTISQVMKDCVKPGVKATRTIFKGKPAIKVDGGPDNIKIYTSEINKDFGGYNKYVLNSDETKILKTSTWTCTAPAKGLSADDKTNIQRTETEGDWKERKDITDTDANLENPKMYEKKVVNGVTLYRKVGRGIAGGLTDEQKKVIELWQGKGYKMRKDLNPEEAKSWVSQLVSPASEGVFSEDLIMYAPPSNITNKNVLDNFQKALQSQKPTSVEDCKTTIEAFFNGFKTKMKFENNVFEPMKVKVQACKNYYYPNNWGFIGGKRYNEMLDILAGKKNGKNVSAPNAYGDDSKWIIQ